MPLVSVVIPAYNCASYIGQTLKSILDQENAPDLEIIVINDGSTDGSGDIVRAFGNPVKIIDQSNAGVCAARNHGLREAKGDFIALVDHDDYWLPKKLENQLTAFEEYPNIDIVFTNFTRWYADDNVNNFTLPSTLAPIALPQGFDPDFSGWIYHQMLLDSWVLTSTALSRRRVFNSPNYFDESLPFSEDWDFWLRVSHQYQFHKLREATTLYRQHASQGSRVIRSIDYRTLLLEHASKKWGLCSKDGRSIPQRQFNRQLAAYCASFALGHVANGGKVSRRIATKAFLKAWSIDRSYWKSLAYLSAMFVGWKPTY